MRQSWGEEVAPVPEDSGLAATTSVPLQRVSVRKRASGVRVTGMLAPHMIR